MKLKFKYVFLDPAYIRFNCNTNTTRWKHKTEKKQVRRCSQTTKITIKNTFNLLLYLLILHIMK